MKKAYRTPCMEIVKLEAKSIILAASEEGEDEIEEGPATEEMIVGSKKLFPWL